MFTGFFSSLDFSYINIKCELQMTSKIIVIVYGITKKKPCSYIQEFEDNFHVGNNLKEIFILLELY